MLGVPRHKYAPPRFIHRPRVAYRSNGRLVVVDISRSRKAIDTGDSVRPMPPIQPPHPHLLEKLQYKPKLVHGASKHVGSPPPEKKQRY